MQDDVSHKETVYVSLVPTGQLFLPDKWILANANLSTKTLYPDYSFYIHHPASGKSLMFDLGIRKVSAARQHAVCLAIDYPCF